MPNATRQMDVERKRAILSLTITVSALLLLVLHLAWPELKVDSITVALVLVAVLPWLGLIFESVSLPGGASVKYRDLARVEREAAAAGLLEFGPGTPQLYASIVQYDPNLALAGLRIEIEKRLRMMGEMRQIDERMGIGQLMNALVKVGALSEDEVSVLRDLNTLLNQAVHGARVEPIAVDWAMSVGPRLLASLDRKLQTER